MRRPAVSALLAAALAAALAACGGPKPPDPATPDPVPTQAGAPDAVVLDSLIATNVVAIMRSQPDLFLPLIYSRKLLGASPAACWTDLEHALTAGYQLQLPKVNGKGNTSYYVLEGNLPRPTVEACLTTALAAVPIKLSADGDLLALTGPDGAATYAGWRGPFIVVGARDLVTQALAAPAEARPHWHDMLRTAGTNPLWWGSTDALFSNLLGVTTTSYQVVFERIETAPNPYFAGRAYATYATAGDAAIAARRIKQGELTLPFDAPELTDSFKRMSVKQAGPTVEIGFDLAMFGGITADTLAGYTAQLMAAQQR